jgi:hypothetical protein
MTLVPAASPLLALLGLIALAPTEQQRRNHDLQDDDGGRTGGRQVRRSRPENRADDRRLPDGQRHDAFGEPEQLACLSGRDLDAELDGRPGALR